MVLWSSVLQCRAWSYFDVVSLAAQLLGQFRDGLRADRQPSQAAAGLSKEDGLHIHKKVKCNALGLHTGALHAMIWTAFTVEFY